MSLFQSIYYISRFLSLLVSWFSSPFFLFPVPRHSAALAPPCGFQSRSPPRGLPPYELMGPSPGGHDRWERERYRQWEKEYTDWYDNQHPSLHHRGRGSRDRERDSMSPLPRDYSPQGRGRRGREERGAPPHHPPSSSSGTKSSTKVLKTKKVKKKKPGEDPEPSHHSADGGDATPVRDEPMDEIPSINKTPPSSSKPASGSGVGKAPTSKSAKASNKTVSKKENKYLT